MLVSQHRFPFPNIPNSEIATNPQLNNGRDTNKQMNLHLAK